MYPKHPVILVHGLNDRQTVFKQMANHLFQLGWSVYSLDLTPNNGQEKLEKLAQQLQQYIDSQFAANQPLDLIGFSMGGLVTRYYLQRLGGIDRVKRYINISAPNRGTLTAYLLPNQGIVQMRPESVFLADLNRDYHLLKHKTRVTTIWTPWDLMILPAENSSLGIGKEIIIPVTLHSQMLRDHRVIHTVTQVLQEPLI